MSAIRSPYEACPAFTGEHLALRLVSLDDIPDLLKCYSDPRARLLFNSDNCTNTFEYSTLDEMRQAIEFWLDEYRRKYYVRFSIVERAEGQVIGTIEFFTKPVPDDPSAVGVLRIDLRSDFESENILQELIQLIEMNFPAYFAFTAIVTRIVPLAERRRVVFQDHGFTPLTDRSIMAFDDYFVKDYRTQPVGL